MGDRLGGAGTLPDKALVELLIEEHGRRRLPVLETLWAYYRNPLEPIGPSLGGDVASSPGALGRGWYRLAQERGLPDRVTGRSSAVSQDDRARGRREVVIENDIAWRIQAMVDFLAGRTVKVVSQSADEAVAGEIERVLDAAWEASGGLGLIQDAALLGHIYGHVDFVVRVDEERVRELRGEDAAVVARESVRIEAIEPTRGVPIVSAGDWRELDGYVIHAEREMNELSVRPSGLGGRMSRLFGGARDGSGHGSRGHSSARRVRGTVTEVFGAGMWQRLEDGEEVERRESELLPGVVPVVHVQHESQPFRYSGLSEVERLIPLQDELNTRLSDRANRVTLQSFRMYLAKGLDGFESSGVGPGVVWTTDNPEASIEAFGGDASSPSEDAHIAEIREAIDKASAVPPLAGGVVRARLGNLSSATALRVTLMGLLAKTARHRVGYGRGIECVSGLVLDALVAGGVLGVEDADKQVRVVWGEALPVDGPGELAAAASKLELGVPEREVLGELGYGAEDVGIGS